MKEDEKKLLYFLQERTIEDEHRPHVRQLVMDLDMNQKRAAYICEKWTNKGWYDWGVNVLAGRLTKEGMSVHV